MAKENLKPAHIIVSTDIALGDDYAAAMAMCAFAAINPAIKLSFVGTYGDRSAREASANLATEIPFLWKQLGQSDETCPQIYKGADRPDYSYTEYTIAPDGLERRIHGEFSPHPDMEKKQIKPVDELYKALKKSQIPIALLSIGAPTEAANITEHAGSLIHQSVAMLGMIGIQGNVKPFVEANASRDPVANERLLISSNKYNIPVTLVPLDCTEEKNLVITPERLQYFKKQLGAHSFGYKALESIAGPESVYGKFYAQSVTNSLHFPYTQKPYSGAVLHDLTAAMVLIDKLQNETPRMFEYAPHILVQPDMLGGIGNARNYMTPHYEVTIAGPTTLHYWPEVMKFISQLQ